MLKGMDDRPSIGINQMLRSLPSLAATFLAQLTSIFTSFFPHISLSPASEDPYGQEMEALVTEEARSLLEANENAGVLSASKYKAAIPWASTPVTSQGVEALLLPKTSLLGNAVLSFISKVTTTVRGSADDIGWLQKDPDMPPVEDGSERFTEILDKIRQGVQRLPDTMVYLLVPGLFSNHGPLYFKKTQSSFEEMGLTCEIAKIKSEASVSLNAGEIKESIEKMYVRYQKQVMVLGHSKGGIDAAAAVSMYWGVLKHKVAGLALAQSPYGGSPIASDILRRGQLGDYIQLRNMMTILVHGLIKGDVQALQDLTYESRRELLKRYKLPKELPIVSFHTEALISPFAVFTLAQVARVQLPSLLPFALAPLALPLAIPVGAAMSACALLFRIWYGEKSDGLVTFRDAVVPGSVVVKWKRKVDHGWMVFAPLVEGDASEANASQVCEALMLLAVEAGQKLKDQAA